MLVELGPVAATEVQLWTRFARRLVAEVRTSPEDLEGVLSDDLLDDWSRLIDEWASVPTPDGTFRWSKVLDTELADFLLHGVVRSYRSSAVAKHITAAEVATYQPFTLHVIHAFIDGLAVEGRSYAHYVAEIRDSLGNAID